MTMTKPHEDPRESDPTQTQNLLETWNVLHDMRTALNEERADQVEAQIRFRKLCDQIEKKPSLFVAYVRDKRFSRLHIALTSALFVCTVIMFVGFSSMTIKSWFAEANTSLVDGFSVETDEDANTFYVICPSSTQNQSTFIIPVHVPDQSVFVRVLGRFTRNDGTLCIIASHRDHPPPVGATISR